MAPYTPAYVPLWCKSNFSFLRGASHPDELIEAAESAGLAALALTDLDGVYGVVRAHMRAKESTVRLLIGAEVSLEDDSRIVVLAQNRTGYSSLCRLLSKGRLRSPKGSSQVSWAEVCEHAPGLVALWGGAQSLLVGEAEPEWIARQLREAFADRLYALVARHRRAEEREAEARLRTRAARHGFPLVAGHEVLYHAPSRRPLHDTLTCIHHGVTLATAGRLIPPNTEHALKSPAAFAELFADDPAAVRRTLEVAERCHFSLAELRYRYPAERLPDGTSAAAYLRALTYAGAHGRYGGEPDPEVRHQLDRELELINELDYGGYFLTMVEIVEYCRAHGILCQGRGSAANSAVCYCLGITAIDPVRMGLLFERFISRERAEPPDIDLDIAHERREEVIQHVYEKYGRERAAMVANVIRYRPRSAVREVGKVLGVPEPSLERLARLLGFHGEVTTDTLAQAGLDPDRLVHQHLVHLTNELLDFPRHLSIHPGGFLLGHEPVHDIVPIENATMDGRTVIQWNKDDLEDLGLFKVDLLALGSLTQLDLLLKLLQKHRGLQLSLATLPANDAATFDMVSRGDTVGVFQIESRAQMAMLPRLKPRTFYDLVIEVSIVRPGPITGGMVHPYLRRRCGEEPVTYPHPALQPVLEKTLGVPLFQEQVMRLAVVAADYTPGEADQLRRDMAAWKRTGRIEAHKDRILSRMQAKGIAAEFAERVFQQIRGFGSYGFPESHAASFALISYAAAYLRCHYPAEFTCALLNAQPMGFYTPATLIDDAKRHDVDFAPIDVTVSTWDCTMERVSPPDAPRDAHGSSSVRMGLRYVKGLSRAAAEALLTTRSQEPFRDLHDLVRRTTLDLGSLRTLAECGALESLARDRRGALWELAELAQTARLPLQLPTAEEAPTLPALDAPELIAWDYGASHHSVRGHPMEALRDELEQQGLPDAQSLRRARDGANVRYAGLVICRQRPSTAKGVVFMTLEDETGFVNVVLWQKVYERFKVVAKTASLLGIRGRVQSQQGVVHLIASELWVPKLERRAAHVQSRDFH